MATRSERIAAHIARRITRNKTQKHFKSLYEVALIEELNMSNLNGDNLNHSYQSIGSPSDGKKQGNPGNPGSSVTSGMSALQNSELRPVVVRKVDFKDLKTGADYCAKGADAVLPPQPAPRAETNDGDEGAGA